MSDELYDSMDTQDTELGISPLGVIVVIVSALVAFSLFLDPNSQLFDVKLGILVIGSMAVSRFAGLQLWENEADLKKTVMWGLVGSAAVGILTFAVNMVWGFSTTATSMIILLALALPGVFEELLFRGGVFLAIEETFGTPIATIVQAFLFALFHSWVVSGELFTVHLDYFIILFVGGIVLQIIFLISKNLLSSMIAHFIINLKDRAGAILSFQIIVLLVALAALFYVLKRRLTNG